MTVTTAGAALDRVVARVRQLLPEDAVISDHARLRTYECDGLAHYRVTPALVVIPEDTAQLAAVVRACAEHQIPYVARGSGTGLSGGALPHKDGVLIVTSRMRAIREVRREDQRAVQAQHDSREHGHLRERQREPAEGRRLLEVPFDGLSREGGGHGGRDGIAS